MTVKEKRLISLLSALLAILFGAVLVLLSGRYRSARRQQEDAAQEQQRQEETVSGREYVNLSYHNGSAFLAFALDAEGAWYWENEPDFPLDDAHLQAVLDQIRDLAPLETLPLPEDLSEYGLDQTPLAQITAVTAEGETEQISLGEKTQDGAGRYALLSREPRRLFTVPDTLYAALQTPIYQMCRLPALPRITEADILSLFLQAPPRTEADSPRTTVLTAYQGDGETTWRTGGANVTSSPLLAALIDDLERFKLAACVNYHPSDDAAALCGFESPVVLTVRYTTGSGGEETFTLSVGTVDLTGQSRYVRMGEEKAIYAMDAALLESLLRLAAGGLEDAGA